MSAETKDKTEIETVAPELEPEYVGAHSSLVNETCQNFIGEYQEDVEACGNEATHTVVMWSGSMHQIAMCDDCGEPEDVLLHENDEREWTGELVD